MEGYLAFIDILGFKDYLLERNSSQMFDEYERILEEATNHDENIKYLLFSDTIILTLESRSEENKNSIFRACSVLLYELVSNNIPVKGGLTYGEYENRIIKDSKIIFGKALIDAYTIEQKQNWVGILISPKVIGSDYSEIKRLQTIKISPKLPSGIKDEGKIRMYKHHMFKWQKYFSFFTEVPFYDSSRKASTIEGFVITPSSNNAKNPGALRKDLTEFHKSLIAMKLATQDPENQRKYQYTIDWVTMLLTLWNKYQDDSLNKYLD